MTTAPTLDSIRLASIGLLTSPVGSKSSSSGTTIEELDPAVKLYSALKTRQTTRVWTLIPLLPHLEPPEEVIPLALASRRAIVV